MKHVTAMVLKYVFIAAITTAILSGVLGYDVGSSLWVSLILTLALYVLGDMMILPSMGNMTATLADAGVALLLVSLAPLYSGVDAVPFTSALAVAALIGVAEYFFHGYLQRTVLPGPVSGEGG